MILTTQKGNRDEKIERIFERINSSGRKLSAHDIRQVCASWAPPPLMVFSALSVVYYRLRRVLRVQWFVDRSVLTLGY